MEGFDNLKAIQISIASPEQVRAWSHGVVKKPETINYRTHRPERDGLFCEKIFGPTRDYECFCGKYKSIRYKGLICERCGVEITRSSERRERMGHIELVTPVAHIWYSKGTPNYIAMLLDISTRDFEKVLYFNSYIVLDPGNLPLLKKQILSEREYQDYRAKYGDMFKAGMGAEAIKFLLKNLDIAKLIDDLKRKLKERPGSQKQNIMKRLEVAETFLNSKSRPEWMILDILPVIPPDLRPMVQLDGGRFATSDLNDLYRRVINRNNRLARLIKLNAPEIIIKNEKRMLQEAVNALIDNGRRGRPVTGPGNRPLKSLNDMLKGKQGRFRQNLLGKRVDYSGRSVIVVGPTLKMHQCGLPQSMALELFKPFIMHKLVDYGLAHNIKSAKRMIEREQDEVWAVLEEVVREHPVLLNRAPTLHRHGIQAFEPVLVEGKAIQLHPLVCEAFNADFDGDQMAVHVPLLLPAKTECRVLLLASNNLLKPANGHAVASPSQDMAIGSFYLTLADREADRADLQVDGDETAYDSLVGRLHNARIEVAAAEDIFDSGKKLLFKQGHVFSLDDVETLRKGKIKTVGTYEKPFMSSMDEVVVAYETGQLALHDRIHVRIGNEIHNTTVGRVIFNSIVPKELGFENREIRKGDLMRIIETCVHTCGITRTAQLLDDLKDLGFKFATQSGLSICIKDIDIPDKKAAILETADKKVRTLAARLEETGDIEEYRQNVVNTWISASDEVTDAMIQNFKAKYERGEFNSVYMMAISGARGKIDQVKQLAGMRGLMANPHGDIIPVPIKANFREGLTMTDYFISTYGARKGLVDTALRTADSGYLTRRLVDVSQDSIIFDNDCGCRKGLLVRPLREKRTPTNLMIDEVIIDLRTRVFGRVTAVDVHHPLTGEVLVEGDCEIGNAKANIIADAEVMVPTDKIRDDSMIGEVVAHPETQEIIVGADVKANAFVRERLLAAGIPEVKCYPQVIVRSPVNCEAREGICQRCYGWDLSTNRLVDIGVAVGVVAAQSIGEPGTQLTMRTFHTGGIATMAKTNIKAKTAGSVIFEELNWTQKVMRGKFVVDAPTGEETDKESDFERNVRNICLGGELIIRTRDIVDENGKVIQPRRLERYALPVGATLKVSHGDTVRSGTILADYNPNDIVSAHGGKVKFKDLVIRDNQVVSKKAKIEIYEGSKLLGQYEIPQRGHLRVEEDDEIVAGDVIAEVALEERSAIAGIDGRVEFAGIKVKNQSVISDSGMIYILPDKSEGTEHEIEMPAGVKVGSESEGVQELPLGSALVVKNGDLVGPDDDVSAIFSELAGTVGLLSDKQIQVASDTLKEYYMTGNMEIEMDEDAKTLTFLSEASGRAKIISYRSSSNKTVDRRRIIIKDERVYIIPDGAQLTFDNVTCQAGDFVEENQKITGPIPFVTDIDGSVTIRFLTLPEELLLDGVKKAELIGRILEETVILVNTGEIVGEAGEEITEELAEAIIDVHEEIGKVVLAKASKTQVITVTNESDTRDYLIPDGATLKVEEGQEVKAGEQLIESFAPIEVETSGKVNFITQYNKHTGEDLIRKIIVYSGRDYFLPVGLPLVVKNGQEIEKGDPITESVTFEEFRKVDRGIKFTRLEQVVKKYHINSLTEILVEDEQLVKVGTKLARIRANGQGVVKVIRALTKSGKVRSIVDKVVLQAGEAHQVLDGADLNVRDGDMVKKGDILAKWGSAGKKTTDIIQGLPRVNDLFELRRPKKEAVIAADFGAVELAGTNINIVNPESQVRQYKAQYGLGNMVVANGEVVEPGIRLTGGSIDPRRLAKIAGEDATQRYLVDEVQHVYRSQGVTISDRHIEVIVSAMMRKVQITKAGDSSFLPSEIVDRHIFSDENNRLLAEDKKPAECAPILQGITKAALTTESWVSAASFQETTRVLTKAAIKGKIDYLRGLKENIIIGKLIPAGTGLFTNKVAFIYEDDRPVEELAHEVTPEEKLARELSAEVEASMREDEGDLSEDALAQLKAELSGDDFDDEDEEF